MHSIEENIESYKAMVKIIVGAEEEASWSQRVRSSDDVLRRCGGAEVLRESYKLGPMSASSILAGTSSRHGQFLYFDDAIGPCRY